MLVNLVQFLLGQGDVHAHPFARLFDAHEKRNVVLDFPVRQGNSGSYRKVFGLGMVDDDRGGRLLGVELVFLGEGDADFFGPG